VGFGISTPDQVRTVCAVADGAIVGSAVVKAIADAGEAPVAAAEGLISELAAGTR
jgi:tryptophan synthase alpha chain